MPVIITILVAVCGAIWWWMRNNPRDALSVADDAVTVMRNAPRKIAFRRQTREHPVEGIDDTRLAITAIAMALLQLDDLPTRDDRQRLNMAIRKIFRLSSEEADEMEVLGKWLQEQCGGASQTISRIGRRLYKIDGANSWGELTKVLAAVVGQEISPRQEEAIQDLRNTFRLR